jgi:hypothetical protein
MTKEEIWKRLEVKRFEQLKHEAINMQGDILVKQARCPKCTLVPPCKHYNGVQEMINDISHFISKPMFKHYLSPRKRDFIFKVIRE